MFITSLNTTVAQCQQANTILPKLVIKAVCKSNPQVKMKTSTLHDVNLDQVGTHDQLKQVISTHLTDDVARGFDVEYYQASTVVTIRRPRDRYMHVHSLYEMFIGYIKIN